VFVVPLVPEWLGFVRNKNLKDIRLLIKTEAIRRAVKVLQVEAGTARVTPKEVLMWGGGIAVVSIISLATAVVAGIQESKKNWNF
jgi:hypothetical protein